MAVELFNQRKWFFGEVGCKLVSAVLLLNLYGSVYFLSIISIDRCFAISAPIIARNVRTSRYGWILSIIAWIGAMTFSAQGFFLSFVTFSTFLTSALFLRKTMTYVYNSTRTYHEKLAECTNYFDDDCQSLTKPDEKFIEFDMCVWDYGTPERSRTVMLTKIVGGFLVPLLIIIGCYTVIIVKARQMRMSSRMAAANNHMNKMIVAVVVSFFGN